MSDKLTYDLVVGRNDLSKSLKDASKEALNLESVLTTAVGVFAGNIATKGFELITGAISSAISSLEQSIDAAAAAEVSFNNLTAALGRAGNNTAQTRADLSAFAAELQRTTTFEDDAAFSSLALLQSLTKLNTDGLQKGVTAAADLATVLGIDLDSATRLVAKGAEGNVEAFKRYGVEIKKGSTDTETFANLIETLNGKFGGAAASQVSTFSGAIKQLSNNFGDVQESIGGLVTNNTTVIAFFNVLSGQLADTSGSIANMQTFFNDATKTIVNFGVAIAQTALEIADLVTTALKPFANAILFIGGIVVSSLIAPIEGLIDGVIALGSVVPGLSDSFKNLENPIKGTSEAIQQFSEGALKSIGDFGEGNAFRSGAEAVQQFGNAIIEAEGKVAVGRTLSQQGNSARVQNETDTNAEVLAQRQQLGLDLQALQLQLANEDKAFQDSLFAIKQEEGIARNQAQIEAIYNQKVAEADAVLQGELLKNQAITNAQNKALADQKAYEAFKLSATKINNEKILATEKALTEEKKRTDKEREQNQKETLSTIASLSSSGNKTLAAIGKAAALTQIAIDTPVAIGKALSAAPPPVNFGLAAAVGAAMAAQAARIAGVAFENGGIVGSGGGATVGPDNRVAAIRDGEMVLNGNQQKKLMDMINNGGANGDIVIKIDEREIFRAVRNQLNNGMRFA